MIGSPTIASSIGGGIGGGGIGGGGWAACPLASPRGVSNAVKFRRRQ